MEWTSRWPALAPDVVRDVAGRLHDAGDFVRLHAICKPWRTSRDVPPPFFQTTGTTQFPPWLIAAADEDPSTPLRLRCIFSKSSYRMPSPPSESWRIWVGSTDGTAVRYLTVEYLRAGLHDLLTGEVIHLPQIPYNIDDQWHKDSPRGIVYCDGTVLVYNISHYIRAALLIPGDTKWRLIERTLAIESPRRNGGFCVAYHRGKILVMEDIRWRVITSDVDVASDVLLQMPGNNYSSHSNYILESRGELLWVSIHAWILYSYREDRSIRDLSVSVYVLQEQVSAQARTQWVRKDNRSLADRVLFLGFPNSFDIDASQLTGHGGCAYFVYNNKSKALPQEQFGVFRYNLISGKAEFVEPLSPGWNNQKCTWLLPQPSITPIQEITKRLRKSPELKQKKQKIAPITSPTRTIHTARHHEPCFRLMVRNLPLKVNSAQLQVLFSKYGKVYDAEVLYYKKTKRSQGIGLLTISTVHAHPEHCLDAFDGLELDGCDIEVILVKEGRRRHSIKAPQVHVD